MGDTKPQPLLPVHSLHPTLEDTEEDFSGNQTSREAGLRGQGGNPLLEPELWYHSLTEQTSAQGSGSDALGKDQGEHLYLQLYTEAESPLHPATPHPPNMDQNRFPIPASTADQHSSSTRITRSFVKERTENCSYTFYTFQPTKSLAWEGHLCTSGLGKSVSKYPYLNPASLLVAGNIPSTCSCCHSLCRLLQLHRPGSARDFWSCQAPLSPGFAICLVRRYSCFARWQEHTALGAVALHRSQSRARAAVPSPAQPKQLPTGKGTA